MRPAWDAAAVRRWCRTALAQLLRAREEIDGLNVYPVPDRDTGSNMVSTMQAVADALSGPPGDLAQTVSAMARGALEGARGNSGVILCQFLRGVADGLTAPGAGLDGPGMAAALRLAAVTGRAAVAEPVDGTMLSVADAAAAAAGAAAADGGGLVSVVQAAAAGARDALDRTPEQLPVLRAAGVVDAGGRGLVVLLDALVTAATGVQPEPPPARPPVVPRDPGPAPATREGGSTEYGYEVQYLLDAADVRALRGALTDLGDSVVVVGTTGRWAVHVHTNDIGAAVEAGLGAGRVHRITVTRFADGPPASRSGRAVVAVVPGPGLARLFAAEGAVVLSGRPAEQALLTAVLSTGAAEVVLLPNDPDLRPAAAAAAAAARARGCRTVVVPTRSPVQGLAALAVADPGREFGDEVVALTDAAGSTRWAELVEASVAAATSAGICRPGDALGLIEGDVAVIGADLAAAADALLDRLLAAGGELVTLVTGDGLPAGVVEPLRERLAHSWPAVEVTVYDGRPGCGPLLVGVE